MIIIHTMNTTRSSLDPVPAVGAAAAGGASSTHRRIGVGFFHAGGSMTVSVEQLQKWLDAKEDEHLEFKEAKTNFHFETLVKYCVALANEGGGKMILGVTDKLPRLVVGSQAFADLERTKAGLIARLRLRVDVEE